MNDELRALAWKYRLSGGWGSRWFPVSLVMARRITWRLKSLEAVARKVVETKSLDQTFPERGVDEIANLGQAFNHMLGDLKLANRRLKDETLREMRLSRSAFRGCSP